MDLIWEGLIQAFQLLLTLDPEVMQIIVLSLKLSGIATVISLAIGLPVGTFLALARFISKLSPILMGYLVRVVWVYPSFQILFTVGNDTFNWSQVCFLLNPCSFIASICFLISSFNTIFSPHNSGYVTFHPP